MELKPTGKQVEKDVRHLSHAIDYLNRLASMVSTADAKKAIQESVFAFRNASENLKAE